MKRLAFFASVMALILSFSALAFAQQTASTEKKQQTTAPAKTEHKSTMAHKGKMEHLKLSKDEIISLQNALTKANVYKGQANGMLDTATKHAIREYQTTNKLKVTGVPNAETLQHLGVSYKAMSAEHSMEKKTEPAPSSKNPPKSNPN
jgi:peptidoglycan hydrolase-like protein with peptidoglycan-binding domain